MLDIIAEFLIDAIGDLFESGAETAAEAAAEAATDIGVDAALDTGVDAALDSGVDALDPGAALAPPIDAAAQQAVARRSCSRTTRSPRRSGRQGSSGRCKAWPTSGDRPRALRLRRGYHVERPRPPPQGEERSTRRPRASGSPGTGPARERPVPGARSWCDLRSVMLVRGNSRRPATSRPVRLLQRRPQRPRGVREDRARGRGAARCPRSSRHGNGLRGRHQGRRQDALTQRVAHRARRMRTGPLAVEGPRPGRAGGPPPRPGRRVAWPPSGRVPSTTARRLPRQIRVPAPPSAPPRTGRSWPPRRGWRGARGWRLPARRPRPRLVPPDHGGPPQP